MRLLTTCVVLMVCLQAKAQLRAVSYKSETKLKLDLLDLLQQAKTDDGFSLVIRDDKPCNDQKIQEVAKYFDWTADLPIYFSHSFPQPITLDKTTGRLKFNSYTKNIDRYLMILTIKGHGWVAKDLVVETDGYQVPAHTYLSNWNFDEGAFMTSKDPFEILRFDVIATLKDRSKPGVLAFGKLELEEYVNRTEGQVFSWLDSLSGNYHSNASMLDRYSQWSLDQLKNAENKLPTFETFGSREGYLSGLIDFKGQATPAAELVFLEKFMMRTVDLYPFYDDKHLDKDLLRSRVKKCFDQEGNDVLAVAEKLRTVVAEGFNDPHFSISIPGTNNSSQKKLPIAIRNIAGDQVIAAVYDDKIGENVPLGSRIASMDMSANTVSLEIESENTLKKITIDKKDKLTIDKKFIPQHGEVRYLADSCVYLRLNNWSGDSFYRVLNLRDAVQKSGMLIVDLRGNGGGYSSDVYDLLSLFARSTYSLGEIDYPWFTESMLIAPSRKDFAFHDDVKVAILVDANTSCASELFILGMKRRPNVWIVGDSNTNGAIASPTLYNFPSGLSVRAHSVIRRYQFRNDSYREGRGIAPDIFVSRTHARDTRPYSDKLLQACIRILDN